MLNSVFLHHCVQAGLDAAIVNPAHVTPYAEISTEERQLADDLGLQQARGCTAALHRILREDGTTGRREDE
ncbi:MAG: hypothetical protein IPK33_25600 [Gemmatimonadetes bacterium]|nr:hypothetical protein [Gemmatimonadota bacterium]